MQRNTYSHKVLRRVRREGTYVHGTNELVGFTDDLVISDSFWEKRSGAKIKEMQTFFSEVLDNHDNFKIGPYNSSYYTFLSYEILKAGSQFIIDNPFTRRAVITFPSDHCFTSIQILVRPGSHDLVHKATIIVNMRSCNVIDNFIDDLYLSYLVSKEVLKHGFGLDHDIKINSMHVSIGSLHEVIFSQ